MGKLPMTPEQKADIDSMTQEEMARLSRFAPFGHPYFDMRNEANEYFQSKFKGWAPELSKKIGW